MTEIGTVAIELSYEDALRLWVLVHDPAHAGVNRADVQIQRLVAEAIALAEETCAP